MRQPETLRLSDRYPPFPKLTAAPDTDMLSDLVRDDDLPTGNLRSRKQKSLVWNHSSH
jgi:hypothetical protein